MKKLIFIIIFLALLATAVYAVEKVQLTSSPVTSSPTPTITPSPTATSDSEADQPSMTTNDPDVIFDIPYLLTKKIDDLNKIIGDPFPGQQLMPPDNRTNAGTWQRGFEKNGVKLYANFNLETGTINSLAILGDKKEPLLKQGNLDEKSKKYTVGVIDIDPTRFLGVTASITLPEKVDISLKYKDVEKVMEITNNEDYAIPKCTITFDNGFFHDKFDGLAAKKTESIIFDLFVRKGGPRNEGERWINSTEAKPKFADIVCDGYVQKNRKAHITF